MTDKALALEASDLSRVYRRGSEEVRALDGVSLSIHRGEFLSLVGPSGSGKTTLVNLLGCLDNPSTGELKLSGRQVFGARPLSERELTLVRREVFGYVFQSFYLVPTLTVRENVALPLAFYRKREGDGDAQVERLLTMLGLERRGNHLPSEISGGEMQRVAIARALVNHPEILIADEPTGNLDSVRAAEIGEVLQALNAEGLTIIVVTHNPSLARLASRTLEMRDGRALE